MRSTYNMTGFFMTGSLLLLNLHSACDTKLKPDADFTFTADRLEVTFTNLSEDAQHYSWNFNDGTRSSSEENPVHVFPRSGLFPVVLIATGEDGLKDTVIYEVEVSRGDETVNSNFTLECPYLNHNNWYRGQLHVHCKEIVNGNLIGSFVAHDPPDVMLETYRDLGYDFVSLTDHSVKTLDPGVNGILFIPGEETHCILDGNEVHANGYNIAATIPDDKAIEDLITNENNLIQLNHPAESKVMYQHIDNSGSGLWAIEIANWESKEELDLWLWDNQVSQGRKVWCNAADDSKKAADAGHNATMVNSATNSRTDIIDNLRAGNFYATEGGPDFVHMDIFLEGNTIHCITNNGNKILWYKHDLQLVKETTGRSDNYTPVGNEVFVRIEVQMKEDDDGNGIPNTAYSQPIFLVYH